MDGARVVVLGLGVTGTAVARHVTRHGGTPVVIEDSPGAAFAERAELVRRAGGEVHERPTGDDLRRLVAGAELVIPSPGVPHGHPVYAAAAVAGTPLLSEIELASRSARMPIVAVTGTNGKTTVTTLIDRMLEASGVRSVPAGNIGRPLLEAVEDDVDVVVAEVSSFQLQYTETFRAHVAVVLNLADDHLDWHPDFEHYRAAKARILVGQQHGDVAVLNSDDPHVASMASLAPARVCWFSLRGIADAYTLVGSGDEASLVDPSGQTLVPVRSLRRRRPHDLADALAASAAALAAGASRDGVERVLSSFEGLPHRLTRVGDAGGVSYYDDSKATNPHAAVAAVRGFPSVVLLAGGRNKGLSLDPLAGVVGHLRGVVAFGEAAPEVAAVFAGKCPVEEVRTMHEAVTTAAAMARPGDAVVLSPACASFDAYDSYAQRGDDFAAEVRQLLGSAGSSGGGDGGGS